MATLCIAATTGLAEFSMAAITDSRLGPLQRLVGAELHDVGSAENAPPAPVMTMDVTAASALAGSKPSTMPCRVARPSPLTGGLAMVITATEPWTLYSAVMLLFLGK